MPKTVFEETKMACSPIMTSKYLMYLCYILFIFCRKKFNLYMLKGREIFNQLISIHIKFKSYIIFIYSYIDNLRYWSKLTRQSLSLYFRVNQGQPDPKKV